MDNQKKLIAQVLDTLKTKVSEFNYNNWFKCSHWFLEESNRVIIQVPSKFVRDWIHENYLPIIKFEFFKLTGIEHEVQFRIQQAQVKVTQARLPLNLPNTPLDTKTKIPHPASKTIHSLNSRYTFSNFVVGDSNQFVYAACQAVATKPAKNYNPLFIYGGVGLGKTHLLHAIGYEVAKAYPHWRTVMVTGEQFTNEVINSIRYQKTYELRQKYRNCDLFLVDDVQFLAGKERTMEEFFHTFNALYENRKQIVLTSDMLPKDILNLEERLRSRFSWGLLADIQSPDFETRMAILKKRSEDENLNLSNDVCHYIASHMRTNIRDLEGCLVRVSAMASLSSTPITIDLVKEVLKTHLRGYAPSLSIETVQQMVANHFQLKITDLKSPRRHKNLSVPRHIAMYLCKKFVKASFPEIGLKFGGKDHTTVMHAFQKITDSVSLDSFVKDNVEHLEKLIIQQN